MGTKSAPRCSGEGSPPGGAILVSGRFSFLAASISVSSVQSGAVSVRRSFAVSGHGCSSVRRSGAVVSPQRQGRFYGNAGGPVKPKIRDELHMRTG